MIERAEPVFADFATPRSAPAAGDRFAVPDRLIMIIIKRMVPFRRHDLTRGDASDLVMCRNPFTYTDPDFRGA